MKKTNTNIIKIIKRYRFKKRLFKRSLLIQIIILLLFAVALHESKPIDINDCKNEQIIVDAKKYHYGYREYKCKIYSNGIRYDFPTHSIRDEYNPREFYGTIQEGDKLDITYKKTYSIRGKENLVVAVKDDTTTYFDLDSYNSQKKPAFISMIVLFAVVELIFFAIVFFNVILNV